LSLALTQCRRKQNALEAYTYSTESTYELFIEGTTHLQQSTRIPTTMTFLLQESVGSFNMHCMVELVGLSGNPSSVNVIFKCVSFCPGNSETQIGNLRSTIPHFSIIWTNVRIISHCNALSQACQSNDQTVQEMVMHFCSRKDEGHSMRQKERRKRKDVDERKLTGKGMKLHYVTGILTAGWNRAI
ncbi:hypothetical protein M514_00697, partial [Trichuris suis]